MASLSLKHIFKVYDGGVKAVNDFCMDIEDKEFIVFVGPSGCGKSTTLRMIAGLEEITAGELRIDDEIVNDFEPKDRNIAMVFQNYALYPHMSVYENMAFSLRTMHMPNDQIHEKVLEAAAILGITEYLERKPKALSGGQRQRVALGRAIVRNPKVFLLDEPLSNLDAKLRAAMRAEISRLHEKLGTTFIYVTHDQVEAMTMGSRIVVMKDGFVQQIDTPTNLYKYPGNMFVAGFIGTPQMNFFEGTVTKTGEDVRFALDCGTNIDMKYIQADKIPVKYAKLIPTERICEKVFACKGNKIFHTPLAYIVSAKALSVIPGICNTPNALAGRVVEILDYGREKYAVIDVYGQTVTALYDGNVDDVVEVVVPVDAVTIKDKSIDIIIV